MSLLGVDIGTSGCKAALLSRNHRFGTCAVQRYSTVFGVPGSAELNSIAVKKAVWSVIREAASGAAKNDPVKALCVSSLGEALVPLSTGRKILGNSILGTDFRGQDTASLLHEKIGQKNFYRINQNIIGRNYGLPKLCWIRDHNHALWDKSAYFLSWSDTINFLLGAPPCAVNSLAQRSLLFDTRKKTWSKTLLKLTEIDENKLGNPCEGGDVIGCVSSEAAAELGLTRETKIIAGGHDQVMNALGSGCVRAGTAACGMGSFECITPVFSEHTDFNTFLRLNLNVENHAVKGLYVSFIYNQAGTLTTWFRNTFCSGMMECEKSFFKKIESEIPKNISSVQTMPYFEMTGAPEFRSASGVITGLSPSTSRGEIYKSILEGITFYFHEHLQALRTAGYAASEFIVSGGGSRSDAWLQIKADIFGLPFYRLSISECGVLGAAALAGIGCGEYRSPEEALSGCQKRTREFTPDMKTHSLYNVKAEQYRKMKKCFIS